MNILIENKLNIIKNVFAKEQTHEYAVILENLETSKEEIYSSKSPIEVVLYLRPKISTLKTHSLIGIFKKETKTFSNTSSDFNIIVLSLEEIVEIIDNQAIDAFGKLMKEKLTKVRKQGTAGWFDPSIMDLTNLKQTLMTQVHKKEQDNCIDIANYAMFLYFRTENNN